MDEWSSIKQPIYTEFDLDSLIESTKNWIRKNYKQVADTLPQTSAVSPTPVTKNPQNAQVVVERVAKKQKISQNKSDNNNQKIQKNSINVNQEMQIDTVWESAVQNTINELKLNIPKDKWSEMQLVDLEFITNFRTKQDPMDPLEQSSTLSIVKKLNVRRIYVIGIKQMKLSALKSTLRQIGLVNGLYFIQFIGGITLELVMDASIMKDLIECLRKYSHQKLIIKSMEIELDRQDPSKLSAPFLKR